MLSGLNVSNTLQVLVIIVNYRTANLTVDSLRSLEKERQTTSHFQVVVVDNASNDNSVAILEAAIEQQGWHWVSLIASENNGGYAYGNNLVIRAVLDSPEPPAYFLLLNPDTQVRSGAVQALIDFMEQHSEVGIAGSSFENADGTPWLIAFRFPSILGELESSLRLGLMTKILSSWVIAQTMENKESQVDWVPGASMIVRRQVFETVGLMDEAYFLYYEETDFCLQARRAGWSCWYVPQSRVMHIAGQSTKITQRDTRPPRLPQYWFNSRQRYFVKNHGRLYASVTDFIWILGFISWKVRARLQNKPDMDPPYFLLDFLRNSLQIKSRN